MADTQDGQHPAASATFEEIEASLRADAAQTAPAEVKLEGDAIPEELRGKSVQDVLTQMDGLKEAVKLSETSRGELKDKVATLSAQVAAVQAVAPAEPPVKEEPAELSVDQFQTLYDESPMKAMEAMGEVMGKRLEANLEARLKPLAVGNADDAEARARVKYATEFELFGDQIEEVLKKNVPDRSIMSTGKTWDDLVAYVKGQPGNVEKLIERKMAAASEEAQRKAQEAQSLTVPFSGTQDATRPPSKPTVETLDDTQKDIIRVMRQSGVDIDEKSYVQWAKVG